MNKTNEDGEKNPTWWEESLSRREANKKIAIAAVAVAGVAVVGGAVALIVSSDDEDETPADALQTQKELGWNVGSDKKGFSEPFSSTTDSKGSSDWKQFLEPTSLMSVWGGESRLQPYALATLPQVLKQTSFNSLATPYNSPEMSQTAEKGKALATLLKNSKEPEKTLIIADVKGPEAVALAAGVADIAEPAITFDNWPHTQGVVPSHRTLGAMLYYAKEVEEAKKRTSPEKKAGILLLDADRLAPYSEESTLFDNRYTARIPSAEQIKKLGYSSVLYVTPTKVTNEADDLNDDFVAYKDQGINVTMLPLSSFEKQQQPEQGTATQQQNPSGYGYGGGSYWFYHHYPIFMPIYTYSPVGYSRVQPPAYTPTQRQTMFSRRTMGGARGTGRMKPTGFGVVSRSSTGRVSFGGARSGSFGRGGAGSS